ncbi:ABC-type branched-chain amino acid transport system, substrate-binding protein [Halobiforma haloterrestris]|uniref:ABC-type branched-chain amino acid transport system, substrate-binding protein n=1 Tax=Natronobacterium haloterrestre TaxID=148448 RepID=A0A1I1EAS1_NATHA|nr:ABC transporter substrate-binding protein [Halobiforma haloterrestris]SFB84234.1 ABC-type branched-chain amino acid transport system, substrate-binding protein [Halobiforma haloterrestris]
MNRNSTRRRLLAGLAGSAVAAFAGCNDVVSDGSTGLTSSETDRASTDRTIKLGTMLPLSGPRSAVGEGIRDAAVLPIEQARDGLEIPLEIEHTAADTESDPAAAAQAAASLVDDGYPMVTGPLDSDIVLQATQQVLIPYQTVCCSPGATTPTLTTLNDGGFVFRTALSDNVQGTVMAEIATAELGHDTAATLYVNNDYGWQLSQAFSRAFRDRGGTVTDQIPVDVTADSYADALERVGEADLAIPAIYPEMAQTLFTDLGPSPDLDVLCTDALREPDLSEQVDYSLNGIKGTAPLIDGPGTETFVDRYTAEYGTEPGLFAYYAYDATAVLLLANAYAGQNDGQAIQSAIHSVTSPGGETITPESIADGITLAAQGSAVEYRGVANDTGFDDNGDPTETTFEYWEFDDSADGGIAELDRIDPY